MRRLPCTPLLVLALGCAGSRPGPTRPSGPPPEEAAAYFPLAPGWKWAYRVEKGGDTILATYTVLETRGDTVVVQAGEERIAYAVLPEGIARRDGLRLGDFLLRSPIRKGATWPLEGGQARVVEVGGTAEVAGETVRHVAVVEENRTSPDRVLRTSYAAGVGAIAIEYLVHDALSGRYDLALRAALVGYTRPGEDPLGAPERSAPPPRR